MKDQQNTNYWSAGGDFAHFECRIHMGLKIEIDKKNVVSVAENFNF